MNPSIHIPYFVAIDPLALLLPPEVYVKIIEALHPHVPLISVMDKVAATMSMKEKEFTLNRVKQVMEYAEVVEKAVAQSA